MYLDSVRNWMDGEKPVVEAESHFLDDERDLVTLGAKPEDYHFFEKWTEKHFSDKFGTKVRSMSLISIIATNALGHL